MSDSLILPVWQQNAEAWSNAIRQQRIASRVEVTNDAIVNAILARKPDSILDVGCGEGWLLRALQGHVAERYGIDGVATLIEKAAELGGGEFSTLSYQAFANGDWPSLVDMLVFNFSLLGEEDSQTVLSAAASLIKPGGCCLVQTLHPAFIDYGENYEAGWRDGSWAGFGDEFKEAHPWYFRSLSDWFTLFSACGLWVISVKEPRAKASAKPASIIFELIPRRP
ncbi:Methyltransferase domain [Spongiibacter sp. IMCC21906]|uniref:class I SAM-dependent methyltransferase n=1 Tax=Spongiibacter sp. IMCC21906 TaxID=1620392 RepID=UPI00062E01FD|nr:class I SAM-dependent methyltransferase [Spongiibacter sp. IMCC21906]AKH70131.1 Methyltransferase domain [Spongiibacter sp. IMCC21906]